MRLNPPLIRPFPSWNDFWSYHPQTEVTSDHTIPRPKWTLIIPSPDRSDLGSYYCAFEPNPRPCNFGLGTHRVRCIWSDQRSLPDGNSTWDSLKIPPIAAHCSPHSSIAFLRGWFFIGSHIAVHCSSFLHRSFGHGAKFSIVLPFLPHSYIVFTKSEELREDIRTGTSSETTPKATTLSTTTTRPPLQATALFPQHTISSPLP